MFRIKPNEIAEDGLTDKDDKIYDKSNYIKGVVGICKQACKIDKIVLKV